MSKRAWLTPDSTPDGMVCYCIYVPKADGFDWALQGALSELQKARNWEDVFQVVSAEDAAAYWQTANELNLPLVECEAQVVANRIGTVFWWPGTGVPSGALVCDGGEYEPTEYPDLFAAIGYVWGQNGTKFALPNLRSYGIVGADFGLAVGGEVGQASVTLTEANLPEFTVPIRRNVASGSNSYVLTLGTSDGATAVQSLPVGSGVPFDIRNPDKVLLPCIEAFTP